MRTYSEEQQYDVGKKKKKKMVQKIKRTPDPSYYISKEFKKKKNKPKWN